MAWTAPKTWSVSEVVTAAMLNTELRDDLNYLKGVSGPVNVVDEFGIKIGASAAPRAALHLGDGDTNTGFTVAQLAFGFQGTADYPHFIHSRHSAAAGTGNAIDIYTCDGTQAGVYPTNATHALTLSNGSAGIGTTTPAAKLHVSGPAGGGFAVFSANDVTSLQTPVAAATIVSGCAMWLWDRNNTTGVAVLGFNGQSFSLGSAPTYVNSDTITVTLTAGGAITVQRTTGTNGSHDINMMILYF